MADVERHGRCWAACVVVVVVGLCGPAAGEIGLDGPVVVVVVVLVVGAVEVVLAVVGSLCLVS